MRDFGSTKNIIEIQDGISGDVHEIYYRMPTNEERAAYQNSVVSRRGRQIKTRLFETRMKYGLKIITGFKKGTIGLDGKPFSSDANDPDYRENWKDILSENGADIITGVALTVFEGTGLSMDSESDSPLEE